MTATSDMAEFFSWPVVLPVVIALIGLGFFVVYAMRNRVEANWAKVFFLAASSYWIVKIIMWGFRTSDSFSFRFVASFAAIGLAGAFLIEALRLVHAKHEEQTAHPSLATPSPTPSASPLASTLPSPPDDGEDILLGRQKGPEVH